jgi:hypothetical protein
VGESVRYDLHPARRALAGIVVHAGVVDCVVADHHIVATATNSSAPQSSLVTSDLFNRTEIIIVIIIIIFYDNILGLYAYLFCTSCTSQFWMTESWL